MKTLKIKIQIVTKFSNGCEWYKDGEVYEVYKFFGDYIVIGLEWAIRSRDVVIL